MATSTTLRKLARTPAKRLRQAFVPEYEDLLREMREVRELHERREAETRHELHELRAQVEDFRTRVELVEDGLHEARRLSLRIAQLTDVVTELVLPLHDRDIDPSVFERLPEDTQ
ncbi:DUF6752 domain-containing protein [Blastococcus sp. HT6-30]|uniref:DUF6752 domain-containing protein n=1 Tax=Blastococcus sp. HT6-30 TaxID=3144843 RepID=UPI0032196FCB